MIHLHHQLAGRFIIEAASYDEDGNEHRRHLAEFDNLITNGGLDMIGTRRGRNNIITNVQVGTGSTTPAFTDTQLASWLATQSGPTPGYPQAGMVGSYHYRRWQWQFAQGAAAGNLTEVGIGMDGGSAGALWSRALILDGAGNPTTLTILSTEFLTITYELRNYPPTGDTTNTVTIDGVPTTITVRTAENTEAESWRNNMPSLHYYGNSGYFGHAVSASTNLGTESSVPDSLVWGDATSIAAYTAGNYYADVTTVYGVSEGNVPGGVINTMLARTANGAFQYKFVPGISKDSTKQLTLTTRHRWGRYTP